jgi:hypothetical protein
MGVKAASLVRERDCTRGTIEEPYPDARLEPRDSPTYA